MEDRVLRRDEVMAGLEKGHPGLDKRTIKGMADTLIETLYGSEEQYVKRLAEEAVRRDREAAVKLDEDTARRTRVEFEEKRREIRNPDALAAFERVLAHELERGESFTVAEARARHEVMKDFGDDAHRPAKLTEEQERDFETLEEMGIYLDDGQKRQVLALQQAYGLSAVDAAIKAGERQAARGREEQEIWERWSDQDREAFDSFDVADRQAFQGLQAAMPGENWTPARYWGRTYGDRPTEAAIQREREASRPRPEPLDVLTSAGMAASDAKLLLGRLSPEEREMVQDGQVPARLVEAEGQLADTLTAYAGGGGEDA